MFGNPYQTGLSFTKILTGLSKTLSIANQVIPIYKEAKPMINNAKTILGVFKDFNKTNQVTTSKTKNITSKKDTTNTVVPNLPKFFL